MELFTYIPLHTIEFLCGEFFNSFSCPSSVTQKNCKVYIQHTQQQKRKDCSMCGLVGNVYLLQYIRMPQIKHSLLLVLSPSLSSSIFLRIIFNKFLIMMNDDDDIILFFTLLYIMMIIIILLLLLIIIIITAIMIIISY